MASKQYRRLIRKGAQLVLATYRPQDGAKVPTGPGWQHNRPTYVEVLEHLNASPDALVGVIPASMHCLLVDVDQGDFQQFVAANPPVATALSRRPGGQHLYYAALDTATPAPTGYSIDLTESYSFKGDVRCRDSFAVIWRPAAVRALLKVSDHHRRGIWSTPAPMELLRSSKAPSAGSGFCSYDDIQKEYWGRWWSQASASVRRKRLIQDARLARRMRQRGKSVKEIAQAFGKSVPTVYRWLDEKLDLRKIPAPWELMEQEWATQRRSKFAKFEKTRIWRKATHATPSQPSLP